MDTILNNLDGWIDSFNYAHGVCQKLNAEGYNVKLRHYVVEEHKLGIYVGLFDSCGSLLKEYASGVFRSFEQMKDSLDYIADRIRRDVRESRVNAVVDGYECTGLISMDEIKLLIYQRKCADSQVSSFSANPSVSRMSQSFRHDR